MNEKVKILSIITGCGLLNCKKALEICDNNELVAYEYLKLISQPVVRCKIINNKKIHWSK